MLKFFVNFLLIISTNCFSNNVIVNKPINKHINKHINYVKYNPLMIQEQCPAYLEKYTNLLNDNQSEILVKKITSFLTSVDGFGGYVLHTNDVLINIILNNDYFPMERKKSIILFLIRVSQYGDSTGSHILQLYHDLVNCLL
tara:strand:+ start:77 stop:502 length:426 start_codon:yes stop_codon:yes gene_type:complete